MERNLAKVLALILTFTLVITLSGCGGEKEASNIIIKNGAIHTVDGDNSEAEAMVIKDGVIEFI